ncbi:hypothetical protein [Sphingobium cupriresistens]|uniref:hypothetical protein n=1 Tax=Sphingobium cupriresistens TaxID=1132417 RepID=UPI003BADC4D8
MEANQVVQSGEHEIAAQIREVMPYFDRYLALREVPLNHRTFLAAIDYVKEFVIAVREGGGDEQAPGDKRDFVATRWFSTIFHHVDAWYRDRYGAAFDEKPDKHIMGLVEIADTPFALHVPTTRTRPGAAGETVWISMPDGVRDDERPIEWVDRGPNMAMLDEEDRIAAEVEASETAARLRYIRTSLMAVSHGDDKLVGLMGGILPRLENAASLLLSSSNQAVQHAYWEMQLACEHALKALRQQQVGTFREIHDLYLLYDDADPKADFARDLLKKMPAWRETGEMRYGVGDRNGHRLCRATYRDTLVIVTGAIRVMKKMGIGNASFEIRRPPWFQVADEVRRASF